MNSNRAKAVSKWISENFQLEWNFTNYSLEKKEQGISLRSPEFQIEFDEDCPKSQSSKWMILLYPVGINADSKNFVSAYLQLIDTKHEKLMVKFEFVLYNSKSKAIGCNEFNSEPFKKGKICGFDQLIIRDNLLRDISHDDVLKIICNIEVSYKVEHILYYSPKWSVINNFDKMRAAGDFIDITIAVGGSEFQAHRNILAARSPVFFSMFTLNMIEANSGRVEIKDTEPEAFEEFLKFIYTGNAKFEEYSFQLLAAADKYDVHDLKTICEDILMKKITKRNCFKILVFSHLHFSKKLKEQALNFIASNTHALSEEIIEAFMNQNKINM